MKQGTRQGLKLAAKHPAGILLAAPGLSLLLCFVAIPFLFSLVLSFTDLRLGSPLPTRFVGLEQYRRLFSDPGFLRALLNNGIFAAVVVPVQTGIALVLALVLNRPLRARPMFRAMFFMPVVFPMALIAVAWKLIYAPTGPINAVFGLFVDQPIDFLNDTFWALPAIMLLSIWQGVGFQMVVLLAGLQSIPRVLYEAARIDRAGAWSQFWHVTLPQLRNPLLFTALVTTILAFRVFDQVQILTRGGPLQSTTTVIYQAVDTIFKRLQAGQAFAMTTIFFGIVFLIAWVQRRLGREEREMQ